MTTTLDDWYLSEVKPYCTDEYLVLAKLIERYRSLPVPNEKLSLQIQIMSSSYETSAHFAEITAVDVDVDYSRRCWALSVLIDLCRGQINMSVDPQLISSVLAGATFDYQEMNQTLALLEKILSDKRLFRATKVEIKAVSKKLAKQLGVTLETDLTTKVDLRKAFHTMALEVAKVRPANWPA